MDAFALCKFITKHTLEGTNIYIFISLFIVFS